MPQTGKSIEVRLLLNSDREVSIDTIPRRAEPLDRSTGSEGQVTDVDLWRRTVVVIGRAAVVVIVITLPQARRISETIGVVTVVVTIGIIVGAISAEIACLDRAIIAAASRTQRQDQKQ